MDSSGHEQGKSSKWRWGWLGLVGAALLLVFVGDSCTAVRKIKFGLDSYMRSAPDYDELERARSGNVAEVPAEAAPTETSATSSLPASEPEPYWTDFLGPGRSSVYSSVELDLAWPEEGPPLAWKLPIGPAYSSVVVASGLVITMEQRRDRECVVAFQIETGREVWNHSWPAYFNEALSKEGPRSTPVIHGDDVFALGATGELVSLDRRTGELNWSMNILTATACENLQYGISATPVVWNDLLIAASGKPKPNGSSVVAVELATGKPRWMTGNDVMAYASPQIETLLGQEMVLLQSAENAFALDPESGTELWSTPWRVTNGLSCTQATTIGDDRVLLSAGYGKGATLVRLSEEEEGFALDAEWRSSRLKTRFNNVVVLGEQLYGLDEGTLVCVDLLTGKRRWKGGRYGYGQMVLAQGHLVLSSEDGELVLIEANPDEHRELLRVDAIDGMTLNPPALAEGFLVIRNMNEMACYDLRVK